LTTFGPLFVPAPLRDAVSDEAWLRAMVEAERALTPELELDASKLDIAALCEEGRDAGNPVEPLVRALREQAGPDVHRGATSQDIVDTAMMLVARQARELIDDELGGLAGECARLAREHRSTPMAARTLLQQAVPTTFGYKAAVWLSGVAQARAALAAVELPAQLGGAAGTLALLGDEGPARREAFASALGLANPVLPWHTQRLPVTQLSAAIAAVAAACAKIGLDVVLLAQTEVGEVREASGGASSTMPHKRNPIRAVLARACARIVHAQAALLSGGEYEHERAAGAWHAEWNAVSTALAFAGGAAAAARECLAGLEVDAERMRANMSNELLSERGEGDPDPASYLGSAELFVDEALRAYA
jgi:3-carboxy-cis,cis-muconate cycloisomerase